MNLTSRMDTIVDVDRCTEGQAEQQRRTDKWTESWSPIQGPAKAGMKKCFSIIVLKIISKNGYSGTFFSLFMFLLVFTSKFVKK